jgi:hypothetical protein
MSKKMENEYFLKTIKTLYNEISFKLAVLRKYQFNEDEYENSYYVKEYSRISYRLFHYNEHVLHIDDDVIGKFNKIDELITFDDNLKINKRDAINFINSYYVLDDLLIKSKTYKQYINQLKSNFKD